MCEVYSPGQVSVIFPHVNFDPKWFVLGGPANGDEAQVFCRRYAGCQALGVEPSQVMREFQKDHDFPGTLVRGGLGERLEQRDIIIPPKQELRSSMVREVQGGTHRVWCTTLDKLDQQFGPFEDAVLWMDIEGMELPALRGGEECFKRRAFRLVNVEVMPDERPRDLIEIEHFLTYRGFWLVHEWDWQQERRNQIWRLR